jgi:formyl-CoA transferase
MGPFVNGESTCFFQINRNKKGIVLDIKNETGRELFYELAKTADIIVENFRPGVTKSLKVDYETIRSINPGIIYCSISGYGQTGPYSHKGGFDLVAQGMSGLMSMTGEPGGRPLKSGIAVYDIGAGITALYSILAAYIYKQRTGEGQHVDVSLAECGLPWFTWEAAAFFSNGTVPGPTGWRHRVSAPYQALKTRNGYIMLGCANQRTWEKLCHEVIGKPEWIEDPRFKTNSDRGANVEALEALLEEVFQTEDRAHWLQKCEAAGVPAGPINNFNDVVQDPHYLEREMIEEVEHPVIGKMKMFGIPTKFSAAPGQIKMPAPLFGQHTDEVLSSMIGLTEEKLIELRSQGIIK